MKSLTLTISEDLLRSLEDAARKQGNRSISSIVREAIATHVRPLLKPTPKRKEAAR